jgi:hypothetical protein
VTPDWHLGLAWTRIPVNRREDYEAVRKPSRLRAETSDQVAFAAAELSTRNGVGSTKRLTAFVIIRARTLS